MAMSVLSEAYAHGPKFKYLTRTAVIAEDPSNTWTATEIATGKYSGSFQKIEENIPNLNFTTSTFWLQFNLSNYGAQPITYFIETARPITNKVNVYEIRNGIPIQLYLSGDDLPFKERPVTYRKFIFPVELEAGEQATYLVELGSDGEVLSAPLKIWDPANFNAFIQRENLTLGIYFGLLIFTIGFFLFFALALRQAIYTYYVSYLVFLFFMQASLDGIAFEYIWPDSPWLANHSIILFSAASVFMLMLYAAEFLQLKNMPIWFRSMYYGEMFFVALCFAAGFTNGFLYEITYPIINGLSLISLIGIILAIVWNQRNNVKVSIFFSLGFIAVLIGGIFFILTNFNVIESEFISQNAIKFGSAAEVVFLSMAMVGRYRDIEVDKETAQKMAFESLEELNKLTRDQNMMLETQVKERTAEIEEKKVELEEKNKEITDSITYAKRIQTAILPPEVSIKKVFPESFILYLAKDIVAGDFYYFEQSHDCTILAAADCTGHGVPGSLVSVVCHNALNRSIREFGTSNPGQILEKTTQLITETFAKSHEEIKDGMDISLMTLGKDNHIQWAGANNPIYVINKMEKLDFETKETMAGPNGFFLHEIAPTKRPVGKSDSTTPFQTHTIAIHPNQTIYLFTDGYADQFGGPKGKKFKYSSFKELLLSIQTMPMREQKELINQQFEDWRGELEQVDDVCVIGVRF